MKARETKVKPGKKVWLLAVLAVIVIAIGAVAMMAGQNQSADMDLKTTYVTMQYPKKFKKYLKLEEVTEGKDVTTIFSMRYDDVEAELFRVAITQEKPEHFEGYFSVDGSEMYVSFTATVVDPYVLYGGEGDESVEKNAEIEALYSAMLDSMSIVVQSVETDARFSKHKGFAENDKQEMKLDYWSVSLPKGITWEEVVEGDIYRAVFYGTVGDKKVKLYAISLGDTAAETPIGQYEVNGTSRIVSVEVFDSFISEALSEEDQATAYMMLDTINIVLDVIRQDAKFHDQLEPVA